MNTSDLEDIFTHIANYSARRRAGDAERPHYPAASYAEQLERFRLPVQDEGVPADLVIRDLIAFSEPGLAAITGPRFHAWVMGGSNPGRRRASMVLPDPGGPSIRRLWPPAAATTRARLACS